MIKNNRKKSSDKFWQFKNNAYLCIAIAKKQVAQRENSSVGRAQPCQGWGRGFESRFSLKTPRILLIGNASSKCPGGGIGRHATLRG